ncbi:hypothetical protein B296_00042284 [Ensete ventricosum]|uniref:Uncharacterized protein n=1 Tax=Ensete ventricosum TaxID=4639 RepID=A0A426X2N2_ENSVE|nr:hypothetical protein B296_00042284 [Ensete ventricosum]
MYIHEHHPTVSARILKAACESPLPDSLSRVPHLVPPRPGNRTCAVSLHRTNLIQSRLLKRQATAVGSPRFILLVGHSSCRADREHRDRWLRAAIPDVYAT